MNLLRAMRKINGSGLKTRLLNPADTLWELRLGVDTSGWLAAIGSENIAYIPTPYSVIRAALNRIELADGDVLVDIGCGKARPLMWAAHRYRLKRAVGLEHSPELAATARHNASRLRGRKCDIEVVQGPAQHYDFADATACYAYHPFHAAPMRQTLARLHESLESQPAQAAHRLPEPSGAAGVCRLQLARAVRRVVSDENPSAGRQADRARGEFLANPLDLPIGATGEPSSGARTRRSIGRGSQRMQTAPLEAHGTKRVVRALTSLAQRTQKTMP